MKTAVLVLALAMPSIAAAQTSATALPIAAPAASIPVGSRVGEVVTGYDDGGRRDPFGSLVLSKRAATPADGRPRSGLAGLSLADVVVKGVVRNGTTMLAILESPGRQSFVTRVKDRLIDATVVSIDRDGVVFSDRSGGTPTEVRKPLRPQGEEVR
ncbi:MAG: hypothetical protein IT184_02020 [Acidobacteria bacterium]|nr:hypothetical protein [Acidobacteriota bacterium]